MLVGSMARSHMELATVIVGGGGQRNGGKRPWASAAAAKGDESHSGLKDGSSDGG